MASRKPVGTASLVGRRRGGVSRPEPEASKTWTDPRDGKEWRVRFARTGADFVAAPNGSGPSGPPERSEPIVIFYHPANPGTTAREFLSADLRGDEDLATMTDQELMELMDEARKEEG